MNYIKIDKEDVCNGEGLRVVLWLSGCSHKCKGCQNPQTWDENSGILFDGSAKEEVFRKLDKDYISGLTLSGGDPLFESNLDGVLDLVTEVNKRYNLPQYIDDKRNGNHNISNGNANKIRLSSPLKTIWIYSGYTWEEIIGEHRENQIEILGNGYGRLTKRAQIIMNCNVLVDGRYIDSQRNVSIPWRGSENQRVIDIKQSLKKGEIVLWQT